MTSDWRSASLSVRNGGYRQRTSIINFYQPQNAHLFEQREFKVNVVRENIGVRPALWLVSSVVLGLEFKPVLSVTFRYTSGCLICSVQIKFVAPEVAFSRNVS